MKDLEMRDSLTLYLENSALQDFVQNFNAPKVKTSEKTIFDVGVRGHFENPMSDILAFYLDPGQYHGLGPLVLRAFLECAKLDHLQITELSPPDREWRLDDGKRIDLVLEGTDWVVAIENKINSAATNDFPRYKTEIQQKYHKKPKMYFLLLAPRDHKIPGWQWVPTTELMNSIKSQIQEKNDPHATKWIFLLREFCQNVINLTEVIKMKENEIQQISEHITEIKTIADVYRSYLEGVKYSLSKELQSLFKDREIGFKIYTDGGQPKDWDDWGVTVILFQPFQDIDYKVFFALLSKDEASKKTFRIQYDLGKSIVGPNDLEEYVFGSFRPFNKVDKCYHFDCDGYETAKQAFLGAFRFVVNYKIGIR